MLLMRPLERTGATIKLLLEGEKNLLAIASDSGYTDEVRRLALEVADENRVLAEWRMLPASRRKQLASEGVSPFLGTWRHDADES